MVDKWFNPEQHTKALCVGNSLSLLGDIPKRSIGYASWLAYYTNVVTGVPSGNTYRPTYNKMKPVVEKVQELNDFITTIATLFSEQLSILVRDQNAAASAYVVLKLLDIVVVLNFLKMFNSALINDFAMFKRSFQQIRGELSPEESEHVAQQSHTLHFFLANPNSVIDELRQAISQIQGVENAFVATMTVGVGALTSPNIKDMMDCEQSGLLRALVYALALQDSQSFNPLTQKAPFLKSLKQLVKANPDVHVHGNLTMSCIVVLRTSPHWQPALEAEWSGADDNSLISLTNCACL
eukprot:c23708_g1_i1.p1 GENE.c23708_g1_i1~~c23708_g1_i1.p1  ORF type:complete len:295 (-),score=75.08 c23708_g1_i1:254-1138(-)